MELIGRKLAHYEIIAPLGKGGMGEVYRATDTNLGRDVALKLLPAEFTSDPERLARFEHEARILASLDHPKIASIFGIESVEGLRFLVMQLAEGEDLANRLRRGSIPVDEALQIAAQIAAALDVAHEKGIVHRDLKPANVMLGPDGEVRVLDFGLAKAFETDEGEDDFSNSPTMVRAATHAGVILGTAAYMSPEQARGKQVDKRADIWAFGVLLREMLTGERLFEGETVSDTLAAVLTKDPGLERLPKNTPASVRWLLERCFERDPRKRLRDIGEARLTIDRALQGNETGPVTAAPAPSPASSRSWREVAAWGLATLLLVLLVWALSRSGRGDSERLDMISRLSVVDDAVLPSDGGSSVIVSADGGMLAFVATEGGTSRLYVKRMNQLTPIPLPGTEGASGPFFSPDGMWIGFFADGKLKKVPTGGGGSIVLCDAPLARGGTWGSNGSIVFTASVAAGLERISENGGTPEPLTTPDASKGERSHRWPHFIPGTDAVLFMAQLRGRNYEDAPIQAVRTADKSVKTILEGAAYPRFSASGHLLFARGGTLFAAPFDPEKLELTGGRQPVLQQLLTKTGNEATDDGTAHFDVSRTGVLVYRQGAPGSDTIEVRLVDRQNNVIASTEPGSYGSPSLSPDGSRVAVGVSTGSRSDIWIWTAASASLSRLTFDGIYNAIPVWSPDGSEVAYSSTRSKEDRVIVGPFARAADGSAAERSLSAPDHEIFGASGWLTSWPAAGTILYQSDSRTRGTTGAFEIYALDPSSPSAGAGEEPLFDGRNADLSPDGRWFAYESGTDIGRDEIFIRPRDGGGRYQVSTQGGMFAHWTKGGSEIVWTDASGNFFAAGVTERGGSLLIGKPERLAISDGQYIVMAPLTAWDVSADGETFVVLARGEEETVDATSVIIDTNWFEELARIVPTE